MPVVAVEEVTDLHICSSCKGTGRVRRGCHACKDCTRCGGVRRINQILVHNGAWNSVCQYLNSLVLAAREFHKQHYEQYMGTVNFLHVERGNAAKLCAAIQDQNELVSNWNKRISGQLKRILKKPRKLGFIKIIFIFLLTPKTIVTKLSVVVWGCVFLTLTTQIYRTTTLQRVYQRQLSNWW